jgi:hypothetical protein
MPSSDYNFTSAPCENGMLPDWLHQTPPVFIQILSFCRHIACQDIMVWILEARQTSKLQNSGRPNCLMLNCTSPCTNPLSQLHWILFIVVARFISAIPIGRIFHNTKSNELALNHRAQININSDKNIAQWLQFPDHHILIDSCCNILSEDQTEYWTSRENSLELIELSSINKVSLV